MYKQIKRGKRFDVKNVSDEAVLNFARGLVFELPRMGSQPSAYLHLLVATGQRAYGTKILKEGVGVKATLHI